MSSLARVVLTFMMVSMTACVTHRLNATMHGQAARASQLAGLSITMGGDTSATLGGGLHIWLRVRNQTDSVVHIFLAGSASGFNPVVEDETGRVIWDRVHGTLIADAPAGVPIPAHGERTYTTTWGLVDWNGNPVPPGRYLVRGRLLLDSRYAGQPFVDAENSPLHFVIRPKK